MSTDSCPKFALVPTSIVSLNCDFTLDSSRNWMSKLGEQENHPYPDRLTQDPCTWWLFGSLLVHVNCKNYFSVDFTPHKSIHMTRTTWGPGRSADLATSSWITFSQQFCFLASYQCRNSQDNFITNQRISTYVIARHIFDKMISSKGISLFRKISEKSQFWGPKIGVPEPTDTKS